MEVIKDIPNWPRKILDLLRNTLFNKEFLLQNRIIVILFLLALVYPIAPMFAGLDYIIHIAVVTHIFAVLAIAWDINGGYTGQSNLATGFFAGVCGYASAILTLDYGLPLGASWIIGMGFSFCAALIIGFPALRIKGPYLTIVTFSVAEVARLLVIFFSEVTRGEEGIGGIPRLFDNIVVNYYWTFFAMIAVLLIAKAIIGSELGLAFRAIAEDEIRAKTLGVDVTKYKIISFSICGIIAGFGGGMYAHYQAHIDPHFFSIAMAITIISFAAIGGERTLIGALVGAYLLQFSSEGLRFITGPVPWVRLSLHGLLLAVVMLFLPGGILSLRKKAEEGVGTQGRLVCEVCGFEYPVPLCCGEQMVIDGEILSCCIGDSCKQREIPMHHGKKMKMIQ
jgi:branched-chain amino acid transport system permease protein